MSLKRTSNNSDPPLNEAHRETGAVIVEPSEDVEASQTLVQAVMTSNQDHEDAAAAAVPEEIEEPDYVKRLRKVPFVGHLLVLVACITMTVAAALIKVRVTQTDRHTDIGLDRQSHVRKVI